jgi:AcrR family transcriptional regulator
VNKKKKVVPQQKKKGVQARKSQATQLALIDTTIRCLVKYGYHGTTYIKISEESGYSRGAMRHHFPSRSDIMKATIDYLHQKRLVAFRKAAANISSNKSRTRENIDALWQHVNHPMFMLFIELSLAARRDRDLDSILRPAQDNFRRECYYSALELFPEWLNRREQIRTAIDLSLYMMEGMVLDNLSTDDDNAKRLLDFLTKELGVLLGDDNKLKKGRRKTRTD